jgi:hypothetical protein
MSPMGQPLTMFEAESCIRRIAKLPTGVGLRSHCHQRMKQWGLDALDIVKMLCNAEMVVPAYKRNGERRCRVTDRAGNAPSERRGVHVVVVIVPEDHLQAHTVYRKR